MIIKKIEIKDFGKFSDYVVPLKPDIQIIYGSNESGKSTLMEFLKFMFYSRRKGVLTSNEDKVLRKKYTPWNGRKMKGSIEIEYKGYEYKIQKEIHESSVSKDSVFFRNNSLGEQVRLGKKQEIGEYLFNLDLSSFERSSYMGDILKTGFENIKPSEDTLLNRIINISESGQEDVQITKVLSRINAAKKELESNNSRNGKIPNLQKKIVQLQKEILSLKEFDKEQSSLKRKSSRLKELIEEKNLLISQLEKIKILKNMSELEEVIIKIKDNNTKIAKFEKLQITEGAIQSLISLKEEIDSNSIRLTELNKLLNSLGISFVEINGDERDILNSKLKEKEAIQNTINNLNDILSSSINLDKSSEALKPYLNKKSQMLKLKKYGYIPALLIFMSINVCKLSLFNKLILNGLFLVAIIFFVLVYKFNMKKARREVSYELDKNLKFLEQDINSLLQRKNCSSITQYYENYAKSQNLLETKSIYRNLKNTIDDLKSKFIKTISLYIDCCDYASAVNSLKNILSQKESIEANTDKITDILSILGLENLNLESLERKLYEFKSSVKDIQILNPKKIKMRLDKLQKLNLENNFFKINSKIKPSENNVASLEEELALKINELSSMKQYLKSLDIANMLIEESSNEIRKNFNPKLNLEASKVFKTLTDSRYEKIYIDRNYAMFAEHNMNQIDCTNLSFGTIDQAYFSLKIAVSKLISNGEVPLLLDDTLIRYDEFRMNKALDFLKENSKTTQTIIFTCHTYVVKCAEKKGIKIIKL